MRYLLILLLSLSNRIYAQKVTKNTDAAPFTFIGRLVEETPLSPHCGGYAWAVVHKYEVIKNNSPDYQDKYFLVCQPCPEFLGAHFFKKGRYYKITVGLENDSPTDFGISNEYDSETRHVFWSRKTVIHRK